MVLEYHYPKGLKNNGFAFFSINPKSLLRRHFWKVEVNDAELWVLRENI
jgi:hypothetical protein